MVAQALLNKPSRQQIEPHSTNYVFIRIILNGNRIALYIYIHTYIYIYTHTQARP